MKKYAVIVAAGSGMRMGSRVPKQFLLLNNRPVLWFTINAFLRAFDDLEIILVLAKDYFEMGKTIVEITDDPTRIHLVEGGETRFHSVKNGLEIIQQPSIVFVHDGVRCLVSSVLIKRCYETALEKGNAVPAINSVDSLRIINENGNQIVDREKIRIIQTPQTFQSEVLKSAFKQEYQESFTDEASVVESNGIKIFLVAGEEMNIKITRHIDLVVAEKFLQELAGM